MIDLEDALAEFVERAPEPPAVEAVVRRGKRRQWRRRGAAFTAAVVVGVAAVGGFVVAESHDRRKVTVLTPPTESVRVTMLDGSQLEISGPESLGLTKLTPAFNAELDYVDDAPAGYEPSHSFSVSRTSPADLGAIVSRHATADGHELIVYRTAHGQDGVVRYPGWSLVVRWNREPAEWDAFAAALHASLGDDGFLRISAPKGWRLGPTDAPDVQFGEALAFFGPKTYPAGCPKTSESATRTEQGWPVSHENGSSWCDADEKTRVHVGDSALTDAAIEGLRVTYTGF